MFQVGAKVPVNYITGEPAPVILEDKDYPEWLFNVGKKGITKNELIAIVEAGGVESLSIYQAKRLKRLLIKEGIKESNALTEKKK
jgi:hypothetical protein